jgi:hypothetical protein
MNEQQSGPQLAFLTAALALLVMPVLVLFGLNALGLAAVFFVPMERMDSTVWWLLLGLFFVWTVLVVGIVLLLAVLLSKRRTVS